MTALVADLQRALRALLTRPSFFLTSVLTLALGICALTAIFSVYDAVLLRPLPFANADRLVQVAREQPPISRGPVARQVFQEWKERSSTVFDAFAGYNATTMNLTGAGDGARLQAITVSPGFWSVFANPVVLGSAFGDDQEQGNEHVVVLSDALWRNQFDAASGIIGRDIALNGESYRVVGVAAPGFAYPAQAQIWLPTYLPSSTAERGSNFLSIVARLRPGVGVTAATQALLSVTDWEAKTWPDNHKGLSASVRTLQDGLTGRFQQPLVMLMLASTLVLLIACANLANLMLARGQTRTREFALRRALGADTGNVVRVVLAEAFVIGAAGAIIGTMAAQPAIRALMALAPDVLPATVMPTIDLRVIALVVMASLIALIIAGLAPAWRATRSDPADALRGGGRDTSDGHGRGRLRAWLVSAEVALAMILLCGSALLIQSLRNLGEVDTGIDSSQVLTTRLALPVPAQRAGEDTLAWFERVKSSNGPRIDAILARVASLPGAARVGMTDSLPISGGTNGNGSIMLPGHDIPMDQNLAEFRFVSADYFATLGIPLRSGRMFEAGDGKEAGLGTRVLVNQAFVDRFLGGADESALGQSLGIIDDTMKTIVGVVGDVRQLSLERTATPEVYFPMRTYPSTQLSLLVKVDGDALAFAEPLRRALGQLAADMPVFDVRTMDEATRATTAMRRFNLTLMSVFAAVALLLAAIGLYGVIAYTFSQRRREIGLRQAIGATRGDVQGLILRAGVRMVVPGLAVGLIGALALGRVIAAQLYGVSTTDPAVLAVASASLVLVALLACLVPTRRASRIAPMEALRDE
jgi:putative ABC transport system permease protein